jgi:hypothetical protein
MCRFGDRERVRSRPSKGAAIVAAQSRQSEDFDLHSSRRVWSPSNLRLYAKCDAPRHLASVHSACAALSAQSPRKPKETCDVGSSDNTARGRCVEDLVCRSPFHFQKRQFTSFHNVELAQTLRMLDQDMDDVCANATRMCRSSKRNDRQQWAIIGQLNAML